MKKYGGRKQTHKRRYPRVAGVDSVLPNLGSVLGTTVRTAADLANTTVGQVGRIARKGVNAVGDTATGAVNVGRHAVGNTRRFIG